MRFLKNASEETVAPRKAPAKEAPAPDALITLPTPRTQAGTPIAADLRRHITAQRRRKRYFRIMFLPGNLGVGLLTLPWVLLMMSGLVPKTMQWLFVIGWFSTYMGCVPVLLSLLKRWETSVRDLAAADDPRLLGPLLETFELQVSHPTLPQFDNARAEARRGILTRMPRLTPNDMAELSSEQRRILHRLMTRSGTFYNYPDPDLSIALLRGLAACGDRRDLPFIQEIAQQRSALYGTEMAEIARQCEEALELRLTNRTARETLLRAASLAIEPDVLLRASGKDDAQSPRCADQSNGV